MAEIIEQRKRVEETNYTRDFHWNRMSNCGFSFPCDKDGNLLGVLTPEAKKNYKACLSDNNLHDDGIVFHKRSYYEDAKLLCDCGKVLGLHDDYMGACECPKCHRWYNLFGQHLNSPETWKEGEDW